MPEGMGINYIRTWHKYPYPGVPQRVNKDGGDILFIAYEGRIVGMATITGISDVDTNDDMSYLEQGTPNDPERYHYIVTGRTVKIDGGPRYKGHMGIRYVDRLKDAKLRAYLKKKAGELRKKLPH